MRSKSHDRAGGDGSAAEGGGAKWGIIPRTYKSAEVLSHAQLKPEGRLSLGRTKLATILSPRHDPHLSTPFLAWSCCKVSLEAHPGWLLQDQAMSLASRFPGVAWAYTRLLHLFLCPGYAFCFPSLFSGAGESRIENSEHTQSQVSESHGSLPPQAVSPHP